MKYTVDINGKVHDVEVKEEGAGYVVTVDGVAYKAHISEVAKKPPAPASLIPPVTAPVTLTPVVEKGAAPGSVTAPMPGTILKVHVSPGDQVKVGDVLLVLEAMKMENEISSPVSGVVKNVFVKERESVGTGDALVEIG